MNPRKYKTLGDLEDKYFGKKGTTEREQYEIELKIELLNEELKAVLNKDPDSNQF
jgi:HTH-type transcriptional regulator / antitoxin HipB